MGSTVVWKTNTAGCVVQFFAGALNVVTGVVAGVTGLTGKARLAYDPGAATTNDIVEVDDTDAPGVYTVELTAGELNYSAGQIVTVLLNKAGASPDCAYVQVVAYDPNDIQALGLNDVADLWSRVVDNSGIPNATAGSAGGLPLLVDDDYGPGVHVSLALEGSLVQNAFSATALDSTNVGALINTAIPNVAPGVEDGLPIIIDGGSGVLGVNAVGVGPNLVIGSGNLSEGTITSNSIADAAFQRDAYSDEVLPGVILSIDDGSPSGSSFTLESGASDQDGAYVGMSLLITEGDAGNLKIRRTVIGYTGSTRLVTLNAPFPVTPADTNKVNIF